MHYANVPICCSSMTSTTCRSWRAIWARRWKRIWRKSATCACRHAGRRRAEYGEINYPFLFGFFDRIGYKGWIGCEYRPATRTEEGLGWLRPYLK